MAIWARELLCIHAKAGTGRRQGQVLRRRVLGAHHFRACDADLLVHAGQVRWPDHEPRHPAVSGRFYPGDREALVRTVAGYAATDAVPRRVRALMGPHAGYVYSGAILGQTYAAVEVPPTVLLLCPNHTGRGLRQSLWCGGAWLTPAGPVEIDRTLAGAIESATPAGFDRQAHLREHAIEVHVPFVAARRHDVRIVPITLARLSLAECTVLGRGLAEVIAQHRSEVLIAASTDMSHFLDARTAKHFDGMALDAALAMDPERLHRTIEEHQISMCGYVPTTVALIAAQILGAGESQLVRYGNSGEQSGDFERVVGYAGALFW